MNFLLGLWSTNFLGLCVGGLATGIAIVSILLAINVFRHEGNAGTIPPTKRKRATGLMAAMIACGMIAAWTNRVELAWLGMIGVSVAVILSVSLYDRANTREVIHRMGLRIGAAAAVSAIGIVVALVAGAQNGGSWSDVVGMFRIGVSMNEQAYFLVSLLTLGAMIGVAPLHIGLSETYSKVASPFGAFAASVLPLVGLVSLFKIRGAADLAMGNSGVWTGTALMTFGAMTIAWNLITILRQTNYKKLFAELSMLHVGIILSVSGFGLAGMIPSMMHIGGLALATCTLFALAGVLHATYKTTKISGIRNMGKLLPGISRIFFLLMAGFAFVPVSSLFMSGMIMFGYGLQQHTVLTIILACAIFVVCCSIAIHVFDMLRSRTDDDTSMLLPAHWKLTLAVCAILVALLGVYGWYVGTENGVRSFVEIVQSIAQL